MTPPELHTNTHVDLTLSGGKTVEGFYRFDMPSATLQIPEVFDWDGQGAPRKITTSGIVSWGTISGSCYQTTDYFNTLHDLFKTAIENPATAKQDYTLTKKTKTGRRPGDVDAQGIVHLRVRHVGAGGRRQPGVEHRHHDPLRRRREGLGGEDRDSAPESHMQTEVPFTLPRGYTDAQGTVHREGTMRLATARDEIEPLREAEVRANEAYLSVLLLSRTITRLGELGSVGPEVVENLYAVDFDHLQRLYERLNSNGEAVGVVGCPDCGHRFEVDLTEIEDGRLGK